MAQLFQIWSLEMVLASLQDSHMSAQAVKVAVHSWPYYTPDLPWRRWRHGESLRFEAARLGQGGRHLDLDGSAGMGSHRCPSAQLLVTDTNLVVP